MPERRTHAHPDGCRGSMHGSKHLLAWRAGSVWNVRALRSRQACLRGQHGSSGSGSFSPILCSTDIRVSIHASHRVHFFNSPRSSPAHTSPLNY